MLLHQYHLDTDATILIFVLLQEVSSPDIKLRRVDETGQELMVEAGNEDNVEMDAQQPQQDVVVDEGLPAELSETPGDMQVVEQEMVVQEQEVLIAPDEVIVGDSEDTYIQEEVVGEQPQQQQQLLVQQQQPQADACSIQQQIEQQIRVETQNQMQLSGHNGIPSQQHRQQQQHRLQQHHQPQQQHIGNIDLVAIAANAEHIPVNTPTMPIKRGRGRPRKSMVSTPQVQRTPMKALISPVIGPDGTIRRSVGRPRKDPNSEYISMASPLVTDGASARRERQMKAKKVFITIDNFIECVCLFFNFCNCFFKVYFNTILLKLLISNMQFKFVLNTY